MRLPDGFGTLPHMPDPCADLREQIARQATRLRLLEAVAEAARPMANSLGSNALDQALRDLDALENADA